MERSLQTRVAVVILALVTLASAALAVFNFVQEGRFQTPTDGVWWGRGDRRRGRQPGGRPRSREQSG